MKKLVLTFASAIIIISAIAQAPLAFKYQAVVRNNLGEILQNQSVGVRISIHENTAGGTIVYQETFSESTNQFGLVNLEIGTGSPFIGTFAGIDWNTNSKFIETGIDPAGGTSYVSMGTSQLLSVPYALHAETVANAASEINGLSDARTDETSIFLGSGAGENDDGNNSNTVLGIGALYLNTDRTGLVAIGDSALFHNGDGALGSQATNNTALGSKSLYSNTVGFNNTAIGFRALYDNTTGICNTANGCLALSNNITGDKNTATGNLALVLNTSGAANTAVGSTALYWNQTGYNNTAIGNNSMFWNSTDGNNNTAIGHTSLYSNTSGYENTAIGAGALFSNTDRSNLVAIGESALYYNGYGATAVYHAVENTAIGSKSLYSNTTGSSNTATGFNALFSNSTGYSNVAIGSNSMYYNTSGLANAAIGSGALQNNTSGIENVAIGYGALYSNIDGYDNIAIGSQAMDLNDYGYENTAIGGESLFNTSSAGRNVAVGFQAGYNNTTGFYNTAVGWGSGPNTWNHKNTTAIGRGATTTAWNQIRIGNNIVTSIGGYTGWSNISDKRFEKAIQNDIVGLDFIMALQPVSYQLDMDKLEQSTGNNSHSVDSSYKETEEEREFNLQSKIEKGRLRQSGFLAQDVEQAAISVGYDFSGIDKPKNDDDFYGLRYAEFVVPLVKAVQEQQAMIDEQHAVIEELRSRIVELEKSKYK